MDDVLSTAILYQLLFHNVLVAVEDVEATSGGAATLEVVGDGLLSVGRCRCRDAVNAIEEFHLGDGDVVAGEAEAVGLEVGEEFGGDGEVKLLHVAALGFYVVLTGKGLPGVAAFKTDGAPSLSVGLLHGDGNDIAHLSVSKLAGSDTYIAGGSPGGEGEGAFPESVGDGSVLAGDEFNLGDVNVVAGEAEAVGLESSEESLVNDDFNLLFAAAFRREHDNWVAQVMAGATVVVTPGISKGEQLMKNECLAKGYPLIHLQKEPIGALWKPEKMRFDACTNGRLLILAPWKADELGDVAGVPSATDYSVFHNLNTLAEEICLFEGEAVVIM